MALERSVLTEESIRALLDGHYGLQVRAAKRLELGTANCYHVETESGSVFLKEFQNGFQREALLREAKLSNYLAENGIPTAKILMTREGEPCFGYGEHWICLEEYVEGEAFGYETFPQERMLELAHILGKIHRVLKSYSLPVDMGKEWLDAYSADGCAADCERLMKIAGERADDPNTLQILTDLQYKRELAYRCEDYKKYYDGVTYCGTHGDYQGCQVLCGSDRIKAVVDFSSARTLPAVWEVMRSFVQSSQNCRQRCVIDIVALREYVKAYMKEFPLTARDLSAMPYVYLFQLARSKYGFPQYLTTNSEDREGLLRFAFWRTEIYRQLEEKAEEISEALLKLL